MKILKHIFLFSFAFLLFSCSEDKMDEINVDRNNPNVMDAKNLIPDLLLKSAFETTATDIAWYATVYIEHAAGTWAQSGEADRRVAQNSASLFNNSWNSLYDVMNIAKAIMDKTDPEKGDEKDNYWCRAIGQIMMAYNLAVATDMWGEVPYSEAFQGLNNMRPKYEKQSDLYPVIQSLLDGGIENMGKAVAFYRDKDYLFGSLAVEANREAWIKFAYSLKARYHLRLSERNGNQASEAALAAIPNAIQSAADQALFKGFAYAVGGMNPWGEFWYWRDHLSVSTTIFNLMNERNDTLRMNRYFTSADPDDIAPSGTANQVQGGYSQSRYTNGGAGAQSPILMFTYQELKFIKAEAKFRLGHADWQDALQEAVEESFAFHGVAINSYFNDAVIPRLTAGNELKEIMTQKYIAMFDREAIEVYNDYRRTGFPEMKNPNNAIVGFVHRFPYALSEVSSNPGNVPSIDVHVDKVWWAGGSE
jgi:hypothetical protein